MRLIPLALAAGLLAAGAAQAQPSCPAGSQPGVVRLSKIKPGKMDLFEKAVRDQRAFYSSKGITTNQLKLGHVVEKDGQLSTTEAMTLHLNSPLTRHGDDPAYKAFVAEFRESSDIAAETRVCVSDVR